MTFLQLVNALQRETSAAGDGVTTVTGQTGEYKRLVEWIQIAHEEIQSMFFDWNFLFVTSSFNTVATVDTVAVPNDLNIWDRRRFYIGEDQIEAMEYINWEPKAAQSGQPSEIIIMPDNTLLLYPNPDDVYTIAYDSFRTPLVLVEDGDSPLFPAQFHRVIVGRAMMLYGNYESAEEIKAQGSEIYQMFLAQLKNNQLSNRQQFYGRHSSDEIRVVAE